MKKYIWMLLLLVCSCTNGDVDSVFDKTPEERVEALKSEYSDILTSSPHGWKVYFSSVNTTGQWLVLMDFDKNGDVTMSCDPVNMGGVVYDESGVLTYRMDFSQAPELVFETYSQFTAWNEIVINGEYAGGETQFIIEKYEDDKFYLKSKSDLGIGNPASAISYFVFEKATEADWEISTIPDVADAMAVNSAGAFVYGSEVLDQIVLLDLDLRMLTLYANIDEVRNPNSTPQLVPFYLTNSGITLVEPIEVEGVGEVLGFKVDIETGAITSVSDDKLMISADAIPRIDIRGSYTFKANSFFDGGALVKSPEGSIITIKDFPGEPGYFLIENATFQSTDGSVEQLTSTTLYLHGNALSVFGMPVGQDLGLMGRPESYGSAYLFRATAGGSVITDDFSNIGININENGDLVLVDGFTSFFAAMGNKVTYILSNPVFVKIN